jgi:hypothetical protein
VHPNFRELCREYGISAKTGYKWRARFVEPGLAGLNDLNGQNERETSKSKRLSRPERTIVTPINHPHEHPDDRAKNGRKPGNLDPFMRIVSVLLSPTPTPISASTQRQGDSKQRKSK